MRPTSDATQEPGAARLVSEVGQARPPLSGDEIEVIFDDADLAPFEADLAGGAVTVADRRASRIVQMAVLLLVFNFLDILLTKLVLREGGSEVNPLLKGIVHDPVAPFVLKLSLPLFVLWLACRYRPSSQLVASVMTFAVAVYGVTVVYNATLLLTH